MPQVVSRASTLRSSSLLNMRLVNSVKYRRTEDAGSGGCPPQAVGCTTNPDEHDLTPAQASSLSQSLAASSVSASSTSTVSGSGGNAVRNEVNPQAVVGIVVIIILVLAFTSLIGYVAFGARGERCCCRTRKDKRKQPVQVEEVQIEEALADVAESKVNEAKLVQRA